MTIDETFEGPAGQGRSASGENVNDPLALRPMALAQRANMFEREVREKLSRSALDLMMAQVEVLSEGQASQAEFGATYNGSTMLTIDLENMAGMFREPCDVRSAQKLARMLGDDPGLRMRVRHLAAQEAERVAGRSIVEIRTDLEVRAQGTKVFVDVDVEATL